MSFVWSTGVSGESRPAYWHLVPSRLGLRVYRAPYSCLGVTERSVKQRPGDVIAELEKRRARDNVRARAPPDGEGTCGSSQAIGTLDGTVEECA